MKYLFQLDGRVSQGTYFKVGLGLMLLKYLVEAGAVAIFCSQTYTPMNFFNPVLQSRSRLVECGPSWLGPAWLLWTLPFIWIAVAMSLRRAVDAGKSPWLSQLMLIPFINLAAMLYLSAVPSAAGTSANLENPSQLDDVAAAWQPPATGGTPNSSATNASKLEAVKAALAGILFGVLYGIAQVVLSVYLFESYGNALFFGTPIVAGAASAYFYNRQERRGLLSTLGQSTLMMLATMSGLLLIALEGAICLLMAAPLMVPLTLFGAIVGRAIAIYGRHGAAFPDRGLASCLLCLPLVAGIEPRFTAIPELEVMSAIEIDAPAETVWHTVIAFPEITSPAPWYFRAGIAMPMRARIEGSGVGAIRHCEFTTGDFVEPITVWDAPHRLAFDVTEQPEPMFEMTPYRHVHPPHLKGSFNSQRGEFRLISMADNKTRLEGRTWYRLDIYPSGYWSYWTNWIVHRIHLRVLDHIKNVAETS